MSSKEPQLVATIVYNSLTHARMAGFRGAAESQQIIGRGIDSHPWGQLLQRFDAHHAPNLANHLPTRIGRRPHNDDPEADMVGAALGFEAQAGGGAAGPAVVAPGAAAAHP